MCGIAGIVKKDHTPVSLSLIKEMTDIVIHRGPDDEGFFINNNLALGHRRLSILDLSNAGHQPFSYGDLKIIFNGEIYNYIELKNELQKAGYAFHSNTDTEIIGAAYIEWGADCVTHFNGMWSFSIYDDKKQILFCSRDRFGIKPFYFVNNSSLFAFGSEIKQLHLLGFNKINLNILFDYLYIGYQNHTKETFYKDIYQLEPSHNLVYNLKTGELNSERYYTLNFNNTIFNLNELESAELYEEKINSSIKLRLRSDVKVGSCLSGGLDSSYIALVAARLYKQNNGKRFTSITAKSNDIKNDEAKYAKVVIESGQLDGKIITPDFGQIYDDIEKIVYHQEEPFGSPSILMQYYVMKAASENGCKVLLDGQGGDETLLGYERYYFSFLKNLPFSQQFTWFKKINQNSKLTMKSVLNYYFYFNFPQIRSLLLDKRMNGIHSGYKDYLNHKLLYEYNSSTANLFQLQKLEITKTQLRSLLNYEDKNSMTWSVETRLPFLDYQVVEAAISIKPQYKLNDGWSKYILRKIGSKILPHEIAWRKNKIGFEAPSIFWDLEKQFDKSIFESPVIRQIFKDPSKINLRKLRWKLLSIALWEKKFGMQL